MVESGWLEQAEGCVYSTWGEDSSAGVKEVGAVEGGAESK